MAITLHTTSVVFFSFVKGIRTRAQDLKILKKSKSVPAESWGTIVGYCVSQLIAVCVLYSEIKISALFEEIVRFITK
jgi:hypothetical protein